MLKFSIKLIFALQLLLVFFSQPTLSFGNFRLKYGQSCRSDYECSIGFKCIESSCRCPKNSVWSYKRQICQLCPYRWLPFNDNCYYISDSRRDWRGAKFDCEQRKSTLLVIDSEHVLDFSINFFTKFRLSGSFYVGAKADVLPSNWTWLNGESIPSSGHIWSQCYKPTESNINSLKMSNQDSCGVIDKFGLSSYNCLARKAFICSMNDDSPKIKWSAFTEVKNSFQIMNNLEKKCNHDYQCPYSQKCIENICRCRPGSVYLYGSKKCISGAVINFVGYLATKNSNDLFVSKYALSWYDSYMWTEKNKQNLYAPTNHLDLIHLLDYLTQKKLKGPYWIGGISIKNSDFWIDMRKIQDGPWFRSFKNCRFDRPIFSENMCLAIEKYELVFKDCFRNYKFISFEGHLNNSINLPDFDIPQPRVEYTKTLIMNDVIVVNELSNLIRKRSVRSASSISPVLTQAQNTIIAQLKAIYVNYTCTGVWKRNSNGFLTLTLRVTKIFNEIEYENEQTVFNSKFTNFNTVFSTEKEKIADLIKQEFNILTIDVSHVEVIDVREEIFLSTRVVERSDCEGMANETLTCTTVVSVDPTVLTTLSKVTSTPETTVPLTSTPETTAPLTSLPETTVPLTSTPETTVPLTSLPETTVPLTSLPETTVPLTSLPETTVPLTSLPETTAPLTSLPETTVPLTSLPETTVPLTSTPEPTTPEISTGPFFVTVITDSTTPN